MRPTKPGAVPSEAAGASQPTKAPVDGGIAMAALEAVAALMEELADWECDPVWPLPLPDPLSQRRGAEALQRILSCLPASRPRKGPRVASRKLTHPVELPIKDLALATAALSSLAGARDRPDIAEFLDPRAQDYLGRGLHCLHGDVTSPPAPYRDRLLTDAQTALDQLLRICPVVARPGNRDGR